MDLKNKFQNKERLLLLLILILLNLFSFGLGFLVGSRIFQPNPIIINGIYY
jgi:hypothetical protein